jgi:hypothetical protein
MDIINMKVKLIEVDEETLEEEEVEEAWRSWWKSSKSTTK